MDTVADILKDANAYIKTILKHKNNNYLRNLMVAAFDPNHKLNLPEGRPPFKKNDINDRVTSGAFWQLCRKISVFERTDTKALQRETQFIQALEGVSGECAEILIHTKDQSLS